jgi:hypothetical protein
MIQTQKFLAAIIIGINQSAWLSENLENPYKRSI